MAMSEIDVINLDFDGIKDSLIKYLKKQDRFKDYNFHGSNLSVLIDLLANNTTYNAFYLNMIFPELFLDTALHRNSVISRCKELNYVPRSMISPTAEVDIRVNDPVETPVILRAGTSFISEAVNGVSYNFVTIEDYMSEQINDECIIKNVILKQGIYNTASWTYDSEENPSQIFTIDNKNIDTTTLRVYVRKSNSEISTDIIGSEYKLATDTLNLNGDSKVFFLQEDFNEKYQIYFGDGVFGKPLEHGNIVNITYISTNGDDATGVSSFILGEGIGNNYDCVIETKTGATNGSEREDIDSIKFTAPKSYKIQRRAVTDEDYITILNNNPFGYTFDTISVWGKGNITYVCCKPKGAFYISDANKDYIIDNILVPASVMTKQFKMVDPEYTFLVFKNTVSLSNKTKYSNNILGAYIKSAVTAFCSESLNKFNATFNATEMWKTISDVLSDVDGYDFDLWLQKRWIPIFDEFNTTTINFDNPIQKGSNNTIEFYPSFSQYDKSGKLFENCFIRELNGKLSSGYYGADGEFITLQEDIGDVDYSNGIINIRSFLVHSINGSDNIFYITAKSTTRNISTSDNRILTFDTSDERSVSTTIRYI